MFARLHPAVAVPLAAVLLAACGGSEPPPAAPPVATTPPPPPPPVSATAEAPPPPPQTQEEAHKLAILAAGCWLGGFWADALGEQDEMKAKGIENRCHELERRVWGADDKAHWEQLRALEQNAQADVVAKVDETAKTDGIDGRRRAELVKLTGALGDAERETMLARRGADRVKRDLAGEPDKLTKDEVEAVQPLRAHAKLDALLKLEAGDLSREANALGLLLALDRVELARGLPKHLKLYAVGDALNSIFGVAMPNLPSDGSTRIVPGTWLRFLTDTANAAGHPVPAKARTPRQKDALAWAGMLEGFHDKLQADSDGIAPTTDLSKVTSVVLHRLDAEYGAQQAAEATEGPKGHVAKPPKLAK
ncbi:MAG TPA: hypothetical protein VGG39_07250 [Polyangiaceae bacterium]|jgi:hypothetical protein